MFIYNVTTHVEPNIESRWLEWMNEEHIPQMIQTGKFKKAIIFKVITENDSGGISYATQYHCSDRTAFECYQKEDADRLKKHALDKFGERILSFRTELEQIIVL
ncbi:MAG: DUF4286 family protein [Flavobacteriaceae bacterium]|nr:DUF4286 family protein [Flavobacteriaceae bacterium]